MFFPVAFLQVLDFPYISQKLAPMCEHLHCTLPWHPIQDIFRSHAQGSQDRFQI